MLRLPLLGGDTDHEPEKIPNSDHHAQAKMLYERIEVPVIV